ncbi:MAG: cysteine hydrolase [Rhizobium sp.]|nr:cysteine hydrolase [Rhizobium sp.]MBX9459739.1 cysteine hydrolase [Rhizobium sp.]
MARTALLALHYQNEVLHPEGRIKVGMAEKSDIRERVKERASALLAFARGAGIPVISVRIAFQPGHTDVIQNCTIFRNVVKNGAMIDGSWGAEFHDGLGPLPGETVVRHTRVNAFFGTDLDAILRLQDVDQLVVAGIATNSVVSTTVAHAADAGYQVTVAEDACSSGNPDLHRACMENMKLVADVLSVDDITHRQWR